MLMLSNQNHQLASFDYIRTLDGWRAVSVIGVVCFHCAKNQGLWPGSIFSKLALRGHVGVDVFFAISGFLICGKLLEELRQNQTISLTRFYLRRCFRILPALCFYLSIIGGLRVIGWLTARNWEFASTLLFVRNYFPQYHNGVVLGKYTTQFWSLGVEEHFYLLWAAIIVLVGPKISRIGWTALVLTISVFVWRVIDCAYGWWIPFGASIDSKTDTRIDALLWGCLAAIAYPYLQAHWKGSIVRYGVWIVIGLAAATIDLRLVEFSIIRAILFPAMVLATAMAPGSVVSRFLELPAMRWVGRLSYSIYIWQQLAMFPTEISHSPLRAIQQFPYNVPIVFLLAAASYYFVERPMIRLGHRITTQTNTSNTPTPITTLPVPTSLNAIESRV
jgi:peptidoglycan/LPS O-acetylase OafA/YrhL